MLALDRSLWSRLGSDVYRFATLSPRQNSRCLGMKERGNCIPALTGRGCTGEQIARLALGITGMGVEWRGRGIGGCRWFRGRAAPPLRKLSSPLSESWA